MSGNRKKYEHFRRRYDVPSYLEMERQFDVDLIKGGCPIYIGVIEMIKGIAHSTVEDVAPVALSLETSYFTMHETKGFSAKQRKELLRVFYELMGYSRRGSEVRLSCDETLAAKFISDFYSYWLNTKGTLLDMYGTMRRAWEDGIQEDEILRYFG